jgi:integrase
VKRDSDGFYTWSESDIAKFEAFYSEGTCARLALRLLLYAAQRRSDVVRMGWSAVKDGFIEVRQQKTKTSLEIPIHPHLMEVLEPLSKEAKTFLQAQWGKPFSPVGFTNWFVDCAKEAGLPEGCTPHGLRKSAARRLAEIG